MTWFALWVLILLFALLQYCVVRAALVGDRIAEEKGRYRGRGVFDALTPDERQFVESWRKIMGGSPEAARFIAIVDRLASKPEGT